MKIHIHCPQCFNEHIPIDDPGWIDVPHSGERKFTCKNGHKCKMVFINPLYELLFESGACALADGYPREAVATFAASIERYYEYITKELLATSGIPKATIERAWKTIKLSERQVGAFRMLFLRELKRQSPDMERRVEFRNGVIHKGEFPTEEEAIQYGQDCLDHITDIEQKLKEWYTKSGKVRPRFTADIESADNVVWAVSGSIIGQDIALFDWIKRRREEGVPAGTAIACTTHMIT